MKKKGNIVQYTEEEVKKLQDKTDWKRLNKMKDNDIDTSDIPPLTDEFWENAKLIKAKKPKKMLSLRLDEDTLEWFKKRGKGYQSYISRLLDNYVASVREKNKHGDL